MASGVSDNYNPSSQTLTFLETEDELLGADTQASEYGMFKDSLDLGVPPCLQLNKLLHTLEPSPSKTTSLPTNNLLPFKDFRDFTIPSQSQTQTHFESSLGGLGSSSQVRKLTHFKTFRLNVRKC